jgi:glycosyltransferase involved in cell wall biosynthesis
MKTVTVLMTTLNSMPFVADAVQSILVQTYQDFELLIVDGGSSDGTVEKIQAISDPRIQLFICPGLRRSAQLNYALKQAAGEYIAIMDSDDIALPQRLEEQARYLQSNTSIALAGSWSEYIDNDGSFLEINKRPLEHTAIVQRLFSFGHPSLSSLMFKKSILESGRYFNESLQGLEDIEWYMRIASVARFGVIPEVLMKFRQRENSLSKQNTDENKKTFIKCVDAYFSHEREGDHPLLPLSLWGIAHYYFGDNERARKLLFQSLRSEGCHSQTLRYLIPTIVFPGPIRHYFRRNRFFNYIARSYRTAGHSQV